MRGYIMSRIMFYTIAYPKAKKPRPITRSGFIHHHEAVRQYISKTFGCGHIDRIELK